MIYTERTCKSVAITSTSIDEAVRSSVLALKCCSKRGYLRWRVSDRVASKSSRVDIDTLTALPRTVGRLVTLPICHQQDTKHDIGCTELDWSFSKVDCGRALFAYIGSPDEYGRGVSCADSILPDWTCRVARPQTCPTMRSIAILGRRETMR